MLSVARTAKHSNGLPGKIVQSSALDVFKYRWDKQLSGITWVQFPLPWSREMPWISFSIPILLYIYDKNLQNWGSSPWLLFPATFRNIIQDFKCHTNYFQAAHYSNAVKMLTPSSLSFNPGMTMEAKDRVTQKMCMSYNYTMWALQIECRS